MKIAIAAGAMLLFAGGRQTAWGQSAPVQSPAVKIQEIAPPAESGMFPSLTTVGDELLVSWIARVPRSAEPPAASSPATTSSPATRPARPLATTRIQFSRFANGQWTSPQTIVERSDIYVNATDVPGLTRSADGALVAVWIQQIGVRPPKVHRTAMVVRSTDDGKTWQDIGSLDGGGGGGGGGSGSDASAISSERNHGFVSLVSDGDGARAFWTQTQTGAAAGGGEGGPPAPSAAALWTAHIAQSISEPVLLDSWASECSPTSAVATPSGPIVAYRQHSEHDGRDVFIARRVASAGGVGADSASWAAPKSVYSDGWINPLCSAHGPAAAANGQQLVIAWYTEADKRPRIVGAHSTDGGATFSKPVRLDVEQPLGRVDVAFDHTGVALACWVANNDAGGSLRLRRFQVDGVLSESIAVPRTPRRIMVGNPTIAPAGTQMLLMWTEDGKPTKLRAALVTF